MPFRFWRAAVGLAGPLALERGWEDFEEWEWKEETGEIERKSGEGGGTHANYLQR